MMPTNPSPNLQVPIELYNTSKDEDSEEQSEDQSQADQHETIKDDHTDDEQLQNQADVTTAWQNTMTPERL